MSFSQSDLPHIKWSLLSFLLILAAGAIAVYLSDEFLHHAQNAKRTEQSRLNEARGKLNAARDDNQNMASYTREYSAIRQRDIIGEEQRLNLIEGLEKIRKRNRVLDFKYAISPQQPYKPDPPLDSANFSLFSSPMSLNLDLLHEQQLINFFGSVRQDMQGWFILEQCTLERTVSDYAQLKAACSGSWLTLKNRNTP